MRKSLATNAAALSTGVVCIMLRADATPSASRFLGRTGRSEAMMQVRYLRNYAICVYCIE